MLVPESLRKDMLNRIHYGHLGIEKCKSRAREHLFWPEMAKQINDVVKNCETCLKYQKANQKETLMPKEIPNAQIAGPNCWQIIGTDIFTYAGINYLLLVDYYSKFVEIAKLSELSSREVILHMKSVFARHGIPLIVYSDNELQFKNQYVKDFAKEWGFEHKTSSPRFPQSNSMAERYVGIIKNTLKKSACDGKDPYLSLLELRNTPITDQIGSPTQLLYNRKIRGLLPHIFQYNNYTRQLLNERQEKQKLFYNRNARDLFPLAIGQPVFVKKEVNKPLEPAIITKYADRPRSYEVQLGSGQQIQRNRVHLTKAPKDMSCKTDLDLSEDLSRKANNLSTHGTDPDCEGREIEGGYPEEIQSTEQTDDKTTPVSDKLRPRRIVKPPSYLQEYVTTFKR